MTRKEMELIRIIQNKQKESYNLIREGEAVLSVILNREMGLSIAETEMMLESYRR